MRAPLDCDDRNVAIAMSRFDAARASKRSCARRAVSAHWGALIVGGEVLVESVDRAVAAGRAEHQGPDVDGCTTVHGVVNARVGDLVTGTVTATDGVDLHAVAAGSVA